MRTEVDKPMPLFDAALSETGKTSGIAQATENKKALLAVLRPKAEALYARLGRPISMDDVVKMMIEMEMDPHSLGNSSGGFFEKSKWRFVDRIQSTRRWAHRNWIGRYELKKI